MRTEKIGRSRAPDPESELPMMPPQAPSLPPQTPPEQQADAGPELAAKRVNQVPVSDDDALALTPPQRNPEPAPLNGPPQHTDEGEQDLPIKGDAFPDEPNWRTPGETLSEIILFTESVDGFALPADVAKESRHLDKQERRKLIDDAQRVAEWLRQFVEAARQPESIPAAAATPSHHSLHR
jgi:hypothetical protein